MVHVRHYRLTAFLFLRLLGFIYVVAFLSLSQQVRPLIGAEGLYPARLYLDRMRAGVESTAAAFVQLPTIFWVDSSDGFMQAAAYVGVALAGLVLCGVANVPLLAVLWFLYMSFVHVGQLFYGYGWENVRRRPCVVAPYHYRLDWQIWFAAMSSYQRNPWLVHLVYKLLDNDPGALSVLANNPFPERPPRFVRAEVYRYRFTDWGDGSGAWWTRTRVDEYLPPLARDSPRLVEYVRRQGWSE
jgi:hypothetical protein